MQDNDTVRELSDLLEQLRWTLTGARAGGIRDWTRLHGNRNDAASRHETSEAARVGTSPLHDENPNRGRVNPGDSPSDMREVPSPPALGAPHTAPLPEPARDIPTRATPEPPFMSREEMTALPRESLASVPSPERGPENPKAALSNIRALLGECGRCGLHAGRRNLVFGEGSSYSGLVFVGEGPGFDEDQQGRPFVGRAGRLLDKMIQAIGMKRQDVYICNVVKCRPPENRTPVPDEIAACSPFLFRQLEALRPKVICALGMCAAQTILGNTRPISSLRGKIHLWRGYPLICTYHPAYLLRSSHQKAAAWQDLKEIRRILASAP